MAESSFAVLAHIGALRLDESSEVKFSIDAYRGYRYASIRKYLTSGGYTGATRAGITMTPEIVKAVAPLLADAIRAIHGKQSVSQIFDEGKQ